MLRRDSKTETTLEFAAEPSVVAQSCQDVLTRIGSVTNVSRETGTITGHVGGMWGWSGRGNISLRIAKKGELTELQIQVSHMEGALTTGKLAAADLAKFADALGQDEQLRGKSTGGW
jgi:hypothetical protein